MALEGKVIDTPSADTDTDVVTAGTGETVTVRHYSISNTSDSESIVVGMRICNAANTVKGYHLSGYTEIPAKGTLDRSDIHLVLNNGQDNAKLRFRCDKTHVSLVCGFDRTAA